MVDRKQFLQNSGVIPETIEISGDGHSRNKNIITIIVLLEFIRHNTRQTKQKSSLFYQNRNSIQFYEPKGCATVGQL